MSLLWVFSTNNFIFHLSRPCILHHSDNISPIDVQFIFLDPSILDIFNGKIHTSLTPSDKSKLLSLSMSHRHENIWDEKPMFCTEKESHPGGGGAPGRRPLPLEGVPLVEGEAALAEPQQLPDVLVQSSPIVTSMVIDILNIVKKAHWNQCFNGKEMKLACFSK